MPNSEWFDYFWREMSETSGGSLVGDGTEGGVIALTKDEYVRFLIGEQGELRVDFADVGISCAYFDDKSLALASIEVSSFFENLTEEQITSMVHNGRDFKTIVDTLQKKKWRLFVTVFPKPGEALLQIVDKYDEVMVVKGSEGIDFNRGVLGMIGFGDFPELCYRAVKRGDEFVVGLGEYDKKKGPTVISHSLAKEVDYIDDICSGKGDRFQKLADKILLG